MGFQVLLSDIKRNIQKQISLNFDFFLMKVKYETFDHFLQISNEGTIFKPKTGLIRLTQLTLTDTTEYFFSWLYY